MAQSDQSSTNANAIASTTMMTTDDRNLMSTTTTTMSTASRTSSPTWAEQIPGWDKIYFPLIMAICSFVFFRLLQFAVRWYLFGKWTFPTFSYFKIRRFRRSRRSTKDMDSKSLKLVPPNKKWRISNEIVSLIHSALSGLWALYILANYDFRDLVNAVNRSAEYLMYMSFGYLVHDFIDLVINERSARIIELLFHHVVVLSAFFVSHVTNLFIYIVVIGLMMEVNSIFLHCRSLLNLYRIKKDETSFKIIALLNLATFVLFRLVVSASLICWLFYHYFSQMVNWYMLVINSIVIYSLSLTNVVLFYRVLAADGLLGETRTRVPTGAPTNADNQSGDEDNDDEVENESSDDNGDVESKGARTQETQIIVHSNQNEIDEAKDDKATPNGQSNAPYQAVFTT